MAVKGRCKIVVIPADVDEPIQEQNITYTEETEVGCVQNLAKAHFKAQKSVKTDAQKEAQRQAILAQVPEEQRKSITDSLMGQALDMGMVEHLTLLSNATDNNFTGVTFYCDDEATALDLPLNPRASQISACAGKPTEVRGDVFVARVFDNEDDFMRLDFTLAEVSSSADWIQQAAAQNEKKRKAESADVRLKKIEEASRAAKKQEVSPAESEKEAGNVAFKQRQYQKAVDHYSRAVELDDTLLVAYNNRAMAWLKLEEWQNAQLDCTHVLSREPANVKALLRQANAREELGQREEALSSYRHILNAEPKNKTALAKLKERQETLQERS